MKNLAALFVFIFLFAASGLAQTNGKITGTVVFTGDRSVIHGASVQISELKRTVNSDDEGNFIFTNVPPGTYTLHAHLEGFGEESQSVVVFLARECLDVRHMLRREQRSEFDHDAATREFEVERVLRIERMPVLRLRRSQYVRHRERLGWRRNFCSDGRRGS